jgi:GH15 family glucan-1,4-alpha-glucosidase
VGCWVPLDRAVELATQGLIPGRHAERWSTEAARIREYVEERCWSSRVGSYTAAADGEDLDAAVLLAILMEYVPSDPRRFIPQALTHGAFVNAASCSTRPAAMRAPGR